MVLDIEGHEFKLCEFRTVITPQKKAEANTEVSLKIESFLLNEFTEWLNQKQEKSFTVTVEENEKIIQVSNFTKAICTDLVFNSGVDAESGCVQNTTICKDTWKNELVGV